MNERTVELFKQASEAAYKLCKENGRKVSETDSIWVAVMAANLAELVAKECVKKCEFIADQCAMTNRDLDVARKTASTAESCAKMIKQHFKIED